MKILLSAGHGGSDCGSIGVDKQKEKDRTMQLAKLVATKLKSAGHTVTVKQEKISSGKWALKNANGYDYALSIHFNAFNGTATGTECLYKNTTGKATSLSKNVANAMGIKNRGAKKRTDLYMLNIGFNNLIEICFHDNKSDLEAYNKNIDKVASAIANSINGSKINDNKPLPTQKPTCDVTGNITYQSYDNIKKQWLPEVINDRDFAGNLGNPMGGLRAKCINGNIYLQVHTINGEWLPIVSSANYKKNDKNNGNSYAGILNKNIDGIRAWSDYGFVEYRVHIKNGKWLPWVKKADNTADGYAGIYGKIIDGVQLR